MDVRHKSPDSAYIAQRVEQGYVQALAKMGRPLLVVNPVKGLVAGVVMWPWVPVLFILGWWLAIVGIFSFRLRLTLGIARHQARYSTTFWRRRFTLLELVSGITLGMLGYSLWFLPDWWPFVYILGIMLTMAGGAVLRSAIPLAYLSFALGATPLLIFFILTSSMPLAGPVAFVVTCCTGVVWLMSTSSHKVLEEAITLRYTNELLVVDLDRQRQRAEQASEAKSAFLANMCHEIRTPMHGMLASLELLGRDQLAARQHQWQQTALSSGKRLLALLNDILDLSKVEQGHLQPTLAPFSPQKLLEETSQLMRASAEHKGLTLRTDEQALPQGLSSDAGWLRQILLNLLGNAIKFSEQGEIRVQASWERQSNILQLQVSDQGIGMCEEQLARLFIPYTQYAQHPQLNKSQQVVGSGLGLAISHRLSGLLGGELSVSSKRGQGSCFTLRVPARQAVLPEAAERQLSSVDSSEESGQDRGVDSTPGSESDSSTAAYRHLKILIAEDDAISRRVLLAMLEDLGLSADWVEDGQRALDQACAEEYDLLIMDWRMPHMDGLEASRQIGARLGERQPQIVILTAQVTETDAVRCLQAGAREMVAKPLGQDALKSLLLRCAARHNAQHTIRQSDVA